MQLKVFAVAGGELGYREKASMAQLDDKTANAGYGNFTKYARDLDALGVYNGRKQGFDWCDMSVDWDFVTAYGVELAMRMTYQPMGGCGAGCTFSMGYYKAHDAFFDSPMPGDQGFFSGDGWATAYHTGLVAAVHPEAGTVDLIEGNTARGAVELNTYAIPVLRYGRPDYSLAGEQQGENINLIQCEINALPDWQRRTVQKLVDRRILEGDGKTLDLEHLTGVRLAVLLDRAGLFDVGAPEASKGK